MSEEVVIPSQPLQETASRCPSRTAVATPDETQRARASSRASAQVSQRPATELARYRSSVNYQMPRFAADGKEIEKPSIMHQSSQQILD